MGKISKQWAGALREIFTYADYFGITCKFANLSHSFSLVFAVFHIFLDEYVAIFKVDFATSIRAAKLIGDGQNMATLGLFRFITTKPMISLLRKPGKGCFG